MRLLYLTHKIFMMYQSLGLMLIFGFIFTSCNSAMPELSSIEYAPVNIKTSNIDPTWNRILIYGTRSDGKEAFGKIYTSAPEIDFELRRGDWTFYGMAFATSSIKSCSIQKATLTKAKSFLTLDFQMSTCADEIFLGEDPSLNASSLPNVTFAVTTVEFCESVNGISLSSDECTDDLTNTTTRKQARGHAQSFQYRIQGFEKTGGKYTLTDSILSNCRNGLPTSGSLRGLATGFLGFDLPAGDESSAPFFIKLEIFPASPSCSAGTPHVVNLPHGLRSQTTQTKYVVLPSMNSLHKLYVKSSGDEICKGPNLNLEFAGGYGTPNSPYLICNETQLYNIFPESASQSLYANYSYKLLRDLDISSYSVDTNITRGWKDCVNAGSNFAPIGTAWPSCSSSIPTDVHFDGGGKKIKGMRIYKTGGTAGLYYALRKTFGNESHVRRLTLEDSEVSAGSFAGMIVGDSEAAFFRQIHLINPRVTSSGSYIGGISGSSNNDTFEDITVTGAQINGARNTGGIIGSAAVTTINRVNVQGSVTSSFTPSDVGGIVGIIGSTNTLSTISESHFSGTVEGISEVGGLAGVGYSLRIENSYVSDATVRSTAVTGAVTGGLVGGMLSKFGTSGIYTSYFQGTIDESCSADDSACLISSIVGFTNGTYAASDFPTAIYNLSSQKDFNATNFGHVQADSEFLTATPYFVNDGGTDITPDFDLDIWEFRNGNLPRLLSGP